MALLEIDKLQTHFRTPDGINRAVDGVSFQIEAGRDAGRRRRIRLRQVRHRDVDPAADPEPPGKIAGADPLPGPQPAATAPSAEMRQIRGNEICDDLPGADDQRSTRCSPSAARSARRCACTRTCRPARPTARAVEMLTLVGIPEPAPARRANTRTSSRAACASA